MRHFRFGTSLLLLFLSATAGGAEPLRPDENLPPQVRSHLEYEQSLSNKSLWPANYFKNEVAPDYIPEARKKFKLPYYLIPIAEAQWIEASTLSNEVRAQVTVGGTQVKLFVHPESEAHFSFLRGRFPYVAAEKSEFWASPTSSYRSLQVWNEKTGARPFIAKVSLDRTILGPIDRLVSSGEALRSLTNQRVLELLGAQFLERAGVMTFPETAGIALDPARFEGAPEKLGGQIIREIPDAILRGERQAISFSSLMAERPGRKPLIFDVIAASGLEPAEFVRKYLLEPYLRMTETFIQEAGLTIEAHAQNLLLEVDAKLRPTGKLALRDFGGLWPDPLRILDKPKILELYAYSENAKTFNFLKSRGGVINNHVVYFKRQVYDLLMAQLARHDPKFRPEPAIGALDQAFHALTQRVYGEAIPAPPTLRNYQSLIEIAENTTPYRVSPGMREIAEAQKSEALRWIRSKYVANEWVALGLDPANIRNLPLLKFYLSNDALLLTDGKTVLGYTLFTRNEKAFLAEQGGNLNAFFSASYPRQTSRCVTRMIRGLR